MNAGSFWIIGCGNMAGAMLSRWAKSGPDLSNVRVVDPAMPALPAGLACLSGIPDGVEAAERVLIAIKPQMLKDAAADIARLVGPRTRILSILAGVDVVTLKAHFPEAASIVRVMPNLPVALGKGIVALHSPSGADDAITTLMAPLGLVEWIADEAQLHLVAALASSGPAFLYRFIDALGVATARLGMDATQAARLALAMVEGSAMLATRSGEAPAALADRVASKGGMTRAGLDVLDADEALVKLLVGTLDAAWRRSVEMGEEAKNA